MSGRRRASAETDAHALLTEHGTFKLPVPVEQIARRLGAVISYEPFEPDVSGLLFRETGRPPVIGVNSANSATRQRFTIAHELGHLRRKHGGETLILDRTVRVNWRDATSSAATDIQEIEANAFAAALLMPDDLIRERLDAAVRGRPTSDDAIVSRLAKSFAVSRQSMEYRLANLGLLSPSG